jgi:hypothetical protein
LRYHVEGPNGILISIRAIALRTARDCEAPMTERECYRRIALFEKADYIPNYDSLPKERLLREWYDQGLPRDVDLHDYFGLLPKPHLYRKIDFDPQPGVPDPEERIARVTTRTPAPEGTVPRCNTWGRVAAWPEVHDIDRWAEGAYHVLEGALEDPSDWEIIRDHFRPDVEKRLGLGRGGTSWAADVEEWRDHESVLVLEAPSMVGEPRMQLGFENYCIKLYDARDMIHKMLDRQTEMAIPLLEAACEEIEFDMLWFWEDMAYRNGPIMSPELFEEIAVPRYRRLADWWRDRGGEIVAVDSDGDVNKLIPGWLKGGINHIWPLEPFAGCDVVAMRKQYGQAFSMRGGVDKFCVGKGRAEIDRELDRIFPVVQDGGFIPHLDHMLPRCTFEDYCYYMERKKEMLASV